MRSVYLWTGLPMELAYSFAGLVVGFIVGLTGIGGGALMTPILIVVFGIPPITAVSTDLIYAAVTKFGGAITYTRKKLIEWKVVILLLAGSVPGSLLTLFYLDSLGGLEKMEHLINLTLGISLVLTSIAVFLRNKIRNQAIKWQHTPAARHAKKWRPLATTLMGLVLGCLVTLSSVGAGALGTALLIVLYPRMSMPTIVGTDLVHAVALTAIAGAGHYQMGSVDLSLLAYLLIGSLPGVFVGSQIGTRLSPKVMQPIMGSILLAIGLRFVIAG
ncbi:MULTISPECIES: sulfite exporter TauE/SafE family protein [unclassified Neptuniibacter]|uniref:sulfite exporter TauE/SafE family protein n=1 Tax=unclassified Neptuniibacter TaxID=2630693 RepID=UPI0025E6CC25|nr:MULTISPECIES: sulfite exporter TauE/SafE family protein [unclassified Neptuniibacter]|tara:strand:- start:5228 stop:6046 length:819 start_codon:yes stop_codon:yes gene_type:complete